MSYEDKTLVCQECGQSFTFTADDQAYHALKGFANEPKRCATCRSSRRTERNDMRSQGNNMQHPVVCAQCGKDTTVPFIPRQGRPVYCSDCFREQSASVSGRR